MGGEWMRKSKLSFEAGQFSSVKWSAPFKLDDGADDWTFDGEDIYNIYAVRA